MKVGQLVTSKSGRDQGRVYIVVQCPDAKTVVVVDGKYRKLAKPKRKNVIHLLEHNAISRDIQVAVAENKLTDEQVRRTIGQNTVQADSGREEGSTVNGKR